jgi:hypothetical protein
LEAEGWDFLGSPGGLAVYDANSTTLMAKKLADLAQSNDSGKALADRVAGSSQETAEIFSSRYTPAALKDKQLGGDAPDGVAIRFAPR